MKKSHRIARKGDTARTRAQAEQTPAKARGKSAPRAGKRARNHGDRPAAPPASSAPALAGIFTEARLAEVAEHCALMGKGNAVSPEAFIAAGLDWWLHVAGADMLGAKAVVERSTGAAPTEDWKIDPQAAQVFAVAIRHIQNSGDPRFRHSMMSGLRQLCLWNPYLRQENDAMRELLAAEETLADGGLLWLADNALPPEEYNDVWSLRDRMGEAELAQSVRRKHAELSPRARQ